MYQCKTTKVSIDASLHPSNQKIEKEETRSQTSQARPAAQLNSGAEPTRKIKSEDNWIKTHLSFETKQKKLSTEILRQRQRNGSEKKGGDETDGPSS